MSRSAINARTRVLGLRSNRRSQCPPFCVCRHLLTERTTLIIPLLCCTTSNRVRALLARCTAQGQIQHVVEGIGIAVLDSVTVLDSVLVLDSVNEFSIVLH